MFSKNLDVINRVEVYIEETKRTIIQSINKASNNIVGTWNIAHNSGTWKKLAIKEKKLFGKIYEPVGT